MRFGDFDDLPCSGNGRAVGCHLQMVSAISLFQSIAIPADHDELPAGFGKFAGQLGRDRRPRR